MADLSLKASGNAFLFPGQGAQHLGMAVDLAAAYPAAQKVFDRARERRGVDYLEICRDGPEALLNSTRISQPVIFLHSMAVLEVLRELGVGAGPFCTDSDACATAGLSLGEYSALVFAASLEFDDALEIVARRGEFMQQACDAEAGAMASVLGLDASAVERVVAGARASGHRVGIANYNSPKQTVISGTKEAVAATSELLKEAGARRAVPLRVAGAYHSELMAPATQQLRPLLTTLRISPPRVAFYSNVTGRAVSDPEEIRDGLIRQVESSVQWVAIVQSLVGESRPQEALELGPGRVLQGLVKGVAPELKVHSVGNATEIQELCVGTEA